MRVLDHPILGKAELGRPITLELDGNPVPAYEGDTIAAALLAVGIKVFHRTEKRDDPRGVFCAIGRCTDCLMTVNGQPNVRTCITPAEDGMKIETQMGLGKWKGGGS
ncbi:MAG: (2Fe-2S)-binding protein [Anaerolineales bacterium]|nr:(2Fe-2S)-binding protein [Anaerolineales bacterium]